MSKFRTIKRKLLQEAYTQNIPITGEFELTGNCNFGCAMCYAKSATPMLSLAEWKSVFDQTVQSGMLFAVLTGGEVFSHPDFIKIYQYLYDLGVQISIYTNGSMVSEDILKLLVTRPPELVAITVYGYDRESYHRFTGVDAFAAVSTNIDRLMSNNINVVLRTIPMPDIYQNLDRVIQFAKDKQLPMGYFLYVSQINTDVPRLNAIELLDFKARMKEAFQANTDSLDTYRCGAFQNGFFVNHQGFLQGCAMMPVPAQRITNNFAVLFDKLGNEWNALVEQSPCQNCSLADNCFTCLARRYLEGNVFACSDYLKAYAEENNR